MKEYIIENPTRKEISILNKNNISWYPDCIDSNDICFECSNDVDAGKIYSLINR